MMSMEPDHYKVLELEPGSPMEDVKSQYRRLAKRDHPDLHGNDARSQEQFRRVNAAYTFLSDAPRKTAYDAVLLAARRAGASPLKVAPPSKSAPPPTATGYHAPIPTAGFQVRPRDDVRMTRSAWLGATAGAIVVVLVIGLSLNGSGPSRPVADGVTSHIPTVSASGNSLGDGSEPGDRSDSGGGSEPDADADPLANSPVLPPAADTDSRHHIFPGIAPLATPVRPGIVGGAWAPPRAILANPSGVDPNGALRRQLLARSRAVLPRTDRLLGRGYAIRAAGLGTEDGARRILREQLAADLADLSAVRARLRPSLARILRQDTPEEMRQEAGPILTDLDRMEDAGQPVRDDIRALAAVPTASGAISAVPHLSPNTFRPNTFRPNTFRPSPLIPMRAASDAPEPAAPAPVIAAAVPPAPKPSEKPAPDPPVKPKAQASSGQEFIMWGK